MHAFTGGGVELWHLVWDVYDELIGLTSLFPYSSWSYAFDSPWRFDGEWSSCYKGMDFGSSVFLKGLPKIVIKGTCLYKFGSLLKNATLYSINDIP
jgi:hypothetical protein